MTIAFVFPGQGSQSVGMLRDLAAAHAEVGHTFAEASAVLGYDLWSRVSEGPEELLNATECTQPAMLTAGVATWRVWCKLGGAQPRAVAGHSLGEFAALVVAGVIDFTEAVDVVRVRGRAMQEAVPMGEGAVAAVLGLDDDAIRAACAEAAQGEVVEAANFNAPGQVVIAGASAAVNRAIEAAKARGAKRAVRLPLSVPTHTSLMRPASEVLRHRLAGVALRAPRLRVFSSVDAGEHRDPERIRELLVRQVAGPVLWSGAVRAMIGAGMRQFVECGPGKVLTGLNRRIEKRPDLACHALEDPDSIGATLAALAGA
ncbi:MAG: ACP S-malonyltransferase [Steroidobacteraceae bacterium]